MAEVAYSVKPEEIFSKAVLPSASRAGITKPIPVFLGKREPTLNTAPLDDVELEGLKVALNEIADRYAKVSEALGQIFAKEIPHMIDFVCMFKAEAQRKRVARNPLVPGSGEIGIQPIIPQVFNKDLFEIPAGPVGTDFYFWGGPTDNDYFRTIDPNVAPGYAIYIVKDGIVQYEAKPVARQLQFNSDEEKLPPFALSGSNLLSIDPERDIFVYNTPGAYVLRWDIGTWLKGRRARTLDAAVEYDIIGIFVYVKDYYETFKSYRSGV